MCFHLRQASLNSRGPPTFHRLDAHALHSRFVAGWEAEGRQQQQQQQSSEEARRKGTSPPEIQAAKRREIAPKEERVQQCLWAHQEGVDGALFLFIPYFLAVTPAHERMHVVAQCPPQCNGSILPTLSSHALPRCAHLRFCVCAFKDFDHQKEGYDVAEATRLAQEKVPRVMCHVSVVRVWEGRLTPRCPTHACLNGHSQVL